MIFVRPDVSRKCVDTRNDPYPEGQMTPRHLLEPGRLAGSALLKAQTDGRLVDLTRAGNDRAFEAIVDRHKAPLLRYCSRILPDGRGEDAVQQTFLKAYNAIHADTTPLSLRSWLFGIAHNVSLNLLRQRGGDHEPLEAAPAGAEDADATIERRERFREVLAAVAALPPSQRDALLLRELEGRGHEEIARELGVSGGAARQLISRARSGIRAAAAAVTPLPLVMRLTDASAAPPTAERLAELTAVGTGVTVSKVVATAAIGTTLIGGAAVTGPDLGQGERDRRGADVAEAAEQEGNADTRDAGESSGGSGRDERDDDSGHRGDDRGERDADDGDDGDGDDERDDRSGHRDGDERDDRSGPGGGGEDDEREDRDDHDNSGPGGGDDDRTDEPDADDNSGPGSGDDETTDGSRDDNSGPGSSDDFEEPDLVEPDNDVIETDRLEVDNSGPGGGDD